MKEDVLISVIIPVYNVYKYLDKCMETVINQTYHNLDIIMIDDGSIDGSGELCDEYAKRDERIRVIHQANKGISGVRNTALNVLKGDYVCFVDSDDYTTPDMIEKLFSAVVTYESDIAICGFYTQRGDNIIIEDPVADEVLLFNCEDALDELIEDRIIHNYLWDKIFKKSMFDGIRFPLGRAYEDMAIMYKLFANADKICKIPDCLYYYQKRSGSISDHFSDYEKWYHNCNDMITAKTERYNFMIEQKNTYLEQKSMASLISIIYEGIKLAHYYSDKEKYSQYMLFLKTNKRKIKENPYIKGKDKKLLFFYQNKAAYSFYSFFHGKKQL